MDHWLAGGVQLTIVKHCALVVVATLLTERAVPVAAIATVGALPHKRKLVLFL